MTLVNIFTQSPLSFFAKSANAWRSSRVVTLRSLREPGEDHYSGFCHWVIMGACLEVLINHCQWFHAKAAKLFAKSAIARRSSRVVSLRPLREPGEDHYSGF